MVRQDDIPRSFSTSPTSRRTSPLPMAHLANSDSPQPSLEMAAVMKRLWKSEELIKQMKCIIKAQHGKIEELRDKLDSEPSSHLKTQLAEQRNDELDRFKDENEQLRRRILSLQDNVGRTKRDNETLRKTNSRFKRMLNQDQPQLPQISAHNDPPHAEHEDHSRRDAEEGDTAPGDFGTTPRRPVTAPVLDSPTIPRSSRGATSVQKPSPVKRRFTAPGTPVGLQPCSKVWRISSLVPLFWKDLQGPTSVLKTLVDVAHRLLEDVPSTAITVYLIDPWLCAAATTPRSRSFSFGDQLVQLFHSDNSRPEPPAIGDLRALPTRTCGMLGLAIQMPGAHKKAAILQVLSTEEVSENRRPRPIPKLLSNGQTAEEPQDNQVGFRDSQLMYLQLVCNIAGGILEQLKGVESKQLAVKQLRSCVDVAVQINQAMTLPDFEQRVKSLLGNFFGVTIVRVLFYDSDTDELIISSAQMQRKGVSKLRLEKGVVGLCARKQTVVHVASISQHPYIDAVADGLQRPGQPIPGEASMLVGPLVVDSVDGPKLVGIVQLLERRKQKTGVTEMNASEFSAEEQNLFTQLLRVMSQVAHRIYKVQELTCQVNNLPGGLIRMLAGAKGPSTVTV